MALAKASSKNAKGKKKPAPKAAPVKAAKKSAPVEKHARKAVAVAKVAAKTSSQKAASHSKIKNVPAKVASPKGAAKAAPVAKVVEVTPIKAPKTAASAKSKSSSAISAGAKALAAYNKSKGGGADVMRGLTDGDTVCREVACENLSTTGGYCRVHYIKNWKKIKRKELILKEKKLNQYIEELVAKYPDKYIEAIRQDLANDKDFAKVIHDLDLDESVDDFDMEGESVEALIDNIKRDFEDGGDDGF